MKRCVLAGACVAARLLTAASSAAAADDATLFRVFLTDGTTLASYGELARVGDRVVFSMPSGGPADNPALTLVNLAAVRVDWDRTNRYAESARAAHYIATQAENDYAALSNEVARTLNEVSTAPDAARRLALVETARKALADWPRAHFNYRSGEVRQMLTMLDEAIADLRAASGAGRFDLSLAAFAADPPIVERLLPPPTPQEAIEQTLTVARMSESPADREALLEAALASLDGGQAILPAEWRAAAHADATAALQQERSVDRAYQSMSSRLLRRVDERARAADVRAVERLLAAVGRRDAALGGKRPDAVAALVAAVDAQLDAARRLRLARDRWTMRAPILRQYRAAIAKPVDVIALFARLRSPLEDIKSMAGSSSTALARMHRLAGQIVQRVSSIVPPDEMSVAHALLLSAARMADTAADIRREAIATNDLSRAWDASSAAAGALMLSARARSEMQTSLRLPQLR